MFEIENELKWQSIYNIKKDRKVAFENTFVEKQ